MVSSKAKTGLTVLAAAIVSSVGTIATVAPSIMDKWADIRKADELNVPVTRLAEAEEQLAMWHKNIDCFSKPAIKTQTAEGYVVEFRVCTIEEILIDWRPPFGKGQRRWVKFSVSPGAKERGVAFAAEVNRKMAASGKVLCRRWLSKTVFRWIRRFGNQCVLEDVHAPSGKVKQRRQVPCNSSC